ncbi:hypothetical protein BDV96DRAFT_607697 [Lophiotrema nucula]|uniref:Uncharacterized protein n=1 Tax=Lophiotrema nucula TaxID=690887 RepID=A0A6A5YGI7_9PLEO|nr:hypothetical protein BDV96DRAFT_607697 [Lophiotrema nucula]
MPKSKSPPRSAQVLTPYFLSTSSSNCTAKNPWYEENNKSYIQGLTGFRKPGSTGSGGLSHPLSEVRTSSIEAAITRDHRFLILGDRQTSVSNLHADSHYTVCALLGKFQSYTEDHLMTTRRWLPKGSSTPTSAPAELLEIGWPSFICIFSRTLSTTQTHGSMRSMQFQLGQGPLEFKEELLLAEYVNVREHSLLHDSAFVPWKEGHVGESEDDKLLKCAFTRQTYGKTYGGLERHSHRRLAYPAKGNSCDNGMLVGSFFQRSTTHQNDPGRRYSSSKSSWDLFGPLGSHVLKTRNRKGSEIRRFLDFYIFDDSV